MWTWKENEWFEDYCCDVRTQGQSLDAPHSSGHILPFDGDRTVLLPRGPQQQAQDSVTHRALEHPPIPPGLEIGSGVASGCVLADRLVLAAHERRGAGLSKLARRGRGPSVVAGA